MADEVRIRINVDDKGAVSGAKRVKASLEDIKKADEGIEGAGTEKLGEEAEKADGGYTMLKNTMANLASQGISMAIGKAAEFASSVVEIGQSFETSMSKVSALSGATGEELGALEAKARELGASTTFSASEAADALGYMALAGWDTQQMLDGVGSVLTLAQAGEMDLAAASDLVTDYLSAFNMEAAEAGRMADVLAYAQANANTTVEGLGMAFKNCSANANAFGMDVETTSAAIAMMANQGLKGSEAGTALNAVMRDMTAQMSDGAIKIGETSVAVMDAEGNYRDFIDIMSDVGAATDGMGDAEKAAALQSTFTADSIKGLNLILNAGADEADYFRECLYNAAGTADETAATMTDNLGGDLAAMNSAFEELSLKVYDCMQEPLRGAVQFITDTVVPGMQGFVDWLTTGTQQFDEFGNVVGEGASPLQTVLDTFAQLAPVITAVGGALLAYKAYTVAVTAAQKLQAAQTKATETATKLLNGTMKANPIGVVITVIGALVSAFMYLWNTSEEFRGFWMGLWDGIMGIVGPAVDWISDKFNWLMGIVGPIFDGIGRAISDPIGTARDTVKGIVDAIMGFFSGIHFELPHIPLPHPVVNPEGWQVIDLFKGVIPSLSIDWYATGGYFNGPSIIGVGEKGGEFVVPEDGPRMRPFAKAVADNMDGGSGKVENHWHIGTIVLDGSKFAGAADFDAFLSQFYTMLKQAKAGA